MFFLLIAAIIGAGFAILSTQNTIGVPVHLGGYYWTHIPLYLIAIASLLVGLLIAWLLSLINWAASTVHLHGKELRARKAETSADRLEARVHDLELENAKLRSQLHETEAVDQAERPSPLERITHSFSR